MPLAVKAVLLRFYRALARLGYAEAALVAAVSQFNQRWELRHGAHPIKTVVVPNGVEPMRYPPLSTEPLRPPLAVGVALAVSAVRLPYGISAHPDARRMVLALAAGVLLGGVYALTLLLATRRRLGAAALVGFAPLLFAAVVGTGSAWAVPPGGPGSLIQVMLPGTVAGLAATYVLGLVTAAHAVFHPGSYR